MPRCPFYGWHWPERTTVLRHVAAYVSRRRTVVRYHSMSGKRNGAPTRRRPRIGAEAPGESSWRARCGIDTAGVQQDVAAATVKTRIGITTEPVWNAQRRC